MKTDLLDAPAESTAIAVQPADSFTSMVERLAANPDVDVVKLERLIAMQERIIDRNAKAAYTSAFVEMQSGLPIIAENGFITNKAGGVQSRFSKYEDIQKAIKPVLQAHGFVMNHRTSFSDRGVKVVGVLSHREGHSEETEFESKADDSGGKNGIQGWGSALSYGMRYTTLTLLNIITAGQDDDGIKAGQREAPKTPDGYDLWRDGMSDMAEQGVAALQVAFQKSKREYREYITKNEPLVWARIKTKAGEVKS